MVQEKTERDREKRQQKARAARTQVLTFSDLGESMERVHHILEKQGDGTWVHYSERIAVEPLDTRLIREEEHARLHEALDRLAPEDRELVLQRYGIEGSPMTLEELGRVRGLGREAIRCRIGKIEKQIKRYLLRRLKTVG
jgi:DNA-directed RNA polymerase sigma subunit (sigma70/sigma32)